MPDLSRENLVNAALAALLLAAPLIAFALDEPFYVSLATRVAILALAGVGLNLALERLPVVRRRGGGVRPTL